MCSIVRVITLDVLPRFGIGPVHLSSTREVVREALQRAGLPLSHERRSLDFFCKNSLQVEYGSDGRADFIGVGSGRELCARYFGIDVFDTPADRVFAAIAEREGGGALQVFNPPKCRFPRQIVTLWEADDQYDHRGGSRWPVWGQIGVGSERYLQAVSAIEAETALHIGRRG